MKMKKRAHSWNKREDDFASVAFGIRQVILQMRNLFLWRKRILPNLDEVFMAKEVIGTKL